MAQDHNRLTVRLMGTNGTFEPRQAPITIGRDETSSFMVEDLRVSRSHAELAFEQRWVLRDLGSSNGTWTIDGRRVHKADLSGRREYRLGDPHSGPLMSIEVAEHQPANTLHVEDPAAPTDVVLGRNPACNLPIPDPIVSWRHARLTRDSAGLTIEDLGSTNGTLVNGEAATRRRLAEGDVVQLGNTYLQVQAGQLAAIDVEGFVADGASLVVRDGRSIVDRVTFSVQGPSLTAIIGPSGAGKSSLLRLLTGQRDPSAGSVRYAGVSMSAHRRAHRGQVGVVPQHTVVHAALSARQALDYTSRLRLPPDISSAERRARVQQVLEQLELQQHADKPVAKLSGGQQRRVGIAMEMLTDPALLILDEPTAGLDPSLVLQVMQVLRQLADAGKQVVLVTHDLDHLPLADHVLVLRAGGSVAYYGPPDRVLRQFDCATWAELFTELANPAPAASDASTPVMGQPQTDVPAPATTVGALRRQTSVVLARHLRLIAADRLYLALLIAMPVALALLALAVPGRDGLTPSADPTSTEGPRLLVLLIVGAVFLGLSAPIRDLVAERSIYHHERDAGLSASAYLAAKVVLFFAIALAQTAILTVSVLQAREPPTDALVLGDPAFEVLVAVASTGLVAVGLGLAISASVGTTEQTMPPLVLVVMGSLVMSGGLFPVDGRGALEIGSWLFPTRWGYGAAAATSDLNHLSAAIDPDDLWAHSASNWWGCMLLLFSMCVAALFLAWRSVQRQGRL